MWLLATFSSGETMSQEVIIIIAGVLFVFVILLFSMKGNSLGKAIKLAKKTRDINPVVKAIEEDKTGDIATSFNIAIKSLWDGYDRELAMDLIHALLERDDKAPISQKWLQDALTIEPELARKQLGKDFIDSHFHEEIAKGCVGCGGSCKTCK